MHHTPKELVLSPHRIGVPYHCMHVAKNITVFTTALGPWYNIKKCVWAGGLISFEQIKYASLHVEMHEFICNHDAYNVVIEKVVVGYHSLMRFLNLYS